MNIENVIKLISTITVFLGTVIPLVIAWIKNLKKYIKEKHWDKVFNEIKNLVEIAEGFTSFSGSQKKDFVLKKAEDFAKENKINFDLDRADSAIEEIIYLTKKVNNASKKQE